MKETQAVFQVCLHTSLLVNFFYIMNLRMMPILYQIIRERFSINTKPTGRGKEIIFTYFNIFQHNDKQIWNRLNTFSQKLRGVSIPIWWTWNWTWNSSSLKTLENELRNFSDVTYSNSFLITIKCYIALIYWNYSKINQNINFRAA